jgi:putative ATPase
MEDANKHGNLPVPMQILNAPTKLMKELGYGKKTEEQPEDLMPERLAGRNYFE